MKSKTSESHYTPEGRVKDPEIAEEMAHIEDPYHEKRLFGLVPPSKKIVIKDLTDLNSMSHSVYQVIVFKHTFILI